MAMPKFVALLLLGMLALSTVAFAREHSQDQLMSAKFQRRYGDHSLKPGQCGGECGRRCEKVGHHHQTCMELCNKCCNKCLCVPPGTYGNKSVCSCYNSWKTKEGGPKCP